MYKIKNIIKLKKKFISKNIKFKKIKNINKKIKIYIKSGGCGGLKYKFINFFFIEKFNILIKKKINILIDNFTKLYINNSLINYSSKKNKFIIKNKNIKNECSCGISFELK